jgi:hypothetical protein
MKVKSERKIIGWREYIALPEFGVEQIKVKVDTGARTSALHVSKTRIFKRRGKHYVDFVIHPRQRSNHPEIQCIAELKEERHVLSSTGNGTIRPVIETWLSLGEESWPIEVTLVNRDVMGFRMLLGRQALRKRFVVDPGRSFVIGKKNSSQAKRKKIKRSRE